MRNPRRNDGGSFVRKVKNTAFGIVDIILEDIADRRW